MENLINLRKTKNLTQSQVANALGLGRQAYAYYEKGDRDPSLSTLSKMADYFNVSVDELLGRVQEPQLFDNAKIERPEILEKFEQLTPHQQDMVMEKVNAYIEVNEDLKLRGLFCQYTTEESRREQHISQEKL